jgi:hypothetical protein
MLYYPQLTTGSIAQFPVTRSVNMRTVANQLPSGFTIRMADTGAQKVQWRLVYSDLTDGERSSLESLFEASQGQLNTFTFLDPTDNLLMWSEDWTQAVWTPDPLLQVASGVEDPLGGQRGDAAHQHWTNHATDPSEHKRAQLVRVLLQRLCTKQCACDDSAGCDGGRTSVANSGNQQRSMDAGDDRRRPLGSTGRHRLRDAVAGRRPSGCVRRSSGGAARRGTIQADHRSRWRLFEHAVFFRLTLSNRDRTKSALLSARLDQQSVMRNRNGEPLAQ